SNVSNTQNQKYRRYQIKKKNQEEFVKATKPENYCIAKEDLLTIIIEALQVEIIKTGLSLNNLFKEMKVSYPVHDSFIQHFNLFDIIRDCIAIESKTESKQYIHWLKSDDSLISFIEALKENSLIES